MSPKQLLRVVGNADGDGTVFFKAQPFVAGNVFQFGWDVVAHGLILHWFFGLKNEAFGYDRQAVLRLFSDDLFPSRRLCRLPR